MKTKDVQLWLNNHYNEVKHWLIVVIGFILVLFAMIQYSNSNRLLLKVKVLAEQNQQLSKENKDLSAQNSSLNQKSIQHTDCVAKIFANYTHNFVPVTIEDIDTCTVISGSDQNTSGNTVSVPQSLSASPVVSSPNPTPNTPSTQSNTSQSSGTSNDSSHTPNCKVDVLFVHLGC